MKVIMAKEVVLKMKRNRAIINMPNDFVDHYQNKKSLTFDIRMPFVVGGI
jgi:hypothetical protein